MKTRKYCASSPASQLAQMSAAQSVPSTEQDSAVSILTEPRNITRVIPIAVHHQPGVAEMAGLAHPKEIRARNSGRTASPHGCLARSGSAEARRILSRECRGEKTSPACALTSSLRWRCRKRIRRRVLINLHGGGFNSDSGSLIEGIPIANLARSKVVRSTTGWLQRIRFPPRSMMSLLVKELLKTTSGGASGFRNLGRGHLPARIAVRLKQDECRFPVFGIFYGDADFSQVGDSVADSSALDGFRANCSPTFIPNHLPRFLRGPRPP